MTWRKLTSPLARSVLTLAGFAAVIAIWKAGVLPATLDDIVDDVSDDGPSQRDLDLLTQNYYEVVMDVDRGQWSRSGLAQIINRLRNKEVDPEAGNWVGIEKSGLAEPADDHFLVYELKADADGTFKGAPFRTNRWRMRDRDYELLKPSRTCRIALVGASNSMGSGVSEEATYGNILEERLNRELPAQSAEYDRYEVLNFSVGGYHILERVYVVDERVPAFKPDIILAAITMNDLRWAVYESLARHIQEGKALHFPFLEEIVSEAGVHSGQSRTRMTQRLKPRREALVRGCMEELRRIADREGFGIAMVNLRLRVDSIEPEMVRQTELARDAGLPTVELFDAYEGQAAHEMYLRQADRHPTEFAHQRLADELFDDLMNHPDIRALLLGEPAEPDSEGTPGADGAPNG